VVLPLIDFFFFFLFFDLDGSVSRFGLAVVTHLPVQCSSPHCDVPPVIHFSLHDDFRFRHGREPSTSVTRFGESVYAP